MKTFTEKELFAWMNEQPEDKPVNMYSGNLERQNHCLLAQFVGAKGVEGANLVTCNGEIFDESDKSLGKVKLSKNCISSYFSNGFESENYGELQTNFKGGAQIAIEEKTRTLFEK